MEIDVTLHCLLLMLKTHTFSTDAFVFNSPIFDWLNIQKPNPQAQRTECTSANTLYGSLHF